MKKFLSFLFCCVLALGITGCGNDTDKIEDNSNSNNNNTVVSEEKIKEKEPLSLETPAGIVLIGSIHKDENGWYFTPEQPLNIKLTYYIDYPEIFDNVTRLEMLSDSEDGFDKTVYEKEVVTITGDVTNPRGAGTLYLVPYKINKGKTVEQSYAYPDLQPPMQEETDYDISELPEKMRPIIENNNYIYNPYLLGKEAIKYYGIEFAEFYIKFVDAYLNYETSVDCPNQGFADKLSVIINYESPLFIDSAFNSFDWYNEKNQTITWNYTKTEKQHNEIISIIKNASNGFLEGVKATDSEREKAMKIFSNFNKEMKYDYAALNTRNNIEAYYAYANHSGICVTFAIAYSQLLTQAGIENTTVSGSTSSGEAHVWNLITIDNKNYFADTTYQISGTEDNPYYYFGMGMDARFNDGSGFDKNNVSIGKYAIKTINDISVSEKSIDDF